jgi:hypothetical protein
MKNVTEIDQSITTVQEKLFAAEAEVEILRLRFKRLVDARKVALTRG